VNDLKLNDGRHLLYLAMPLLKGETLQDRLKRSDAAPLSLDEQRSIGLHIAIGKYEITQEQYEALMGINPSEFRIAGRAGDKVKVLDTRRFPVETVNWRDAQQFVQKLSTQSEKNGRPRSYRLPRECEWEYACRSGDFGKDSQRYHVQTGPQFAIDWTEANMDGRFPNDGPEVKKCLERTSKVGSYGPNYFGLCDMHGNVFEWCEDWYGETYYANSPKIDPKGPENGTEWVLRGGGWSIMEGNCRAAYRSHDDGQLRMLFNGFRVVAMIR